MQKLLKEITRTYKGYEVSTTLQLPQDEKPEPVLIRTQDALKMIRDAGKSLSRPTLLKYGKEGRLRRHHLRQKISCRDSSPLPEYHWPSSVILVLRGYLPETTSI